MRSYHPLSAGLLIWLFLMCGCAASSYPPASAEERAANKILDRWVSVSGGAGAFKDIQSVQTEGLMDFGASGPSLTTRSWAMLDGLFRHEIDTPLFGDSIMASDGKTVWRQNAKLGFGLVDPRLGAQMMRASDPQEEIHLDRYYPGRRRLADVELKGRTLQVVELRTFEDAIERWYMDSATGLRVRVERANETVEYSDFRHVGSFTFPYVISYPGKGGTMSVRLKSLVLNPKIHASIFVPPASLMQDAAVVSRILERYTFVSGAYRLAKVQTRVTHTTMTMLKTGVETEMTITQKRPFLVLIEQLVAGTGRTVQGFDGKTAWENSDMQGYRELKGPELQQLLNNADLDAEAKLGIQSPLRTLLGERVVNGHRTQAVALANFQGPGGTYYFDEDSGHLVRVESSLVSGPKSYMQATMDLSDFREVDGVNIAYRTIINNPAVSVVMTVTAVEQNVPVDDAIFTPKRDD